MKILKRKTLAALLALSLLASLLPLGAQPAQATDGDQTVYVGGVALTGSTDNPAYATTDDSGNVSTDSATTDDYNIKWDGSTLTLDGAKIKGGTSSESLGLTAGIYAFNNSGGVSLNIALKDVNEIFESSYGIWVYSSSTNAGNATLTIEGDGSLNASGILHGILVQSNGGDATLTIQSADVTLTSNSGNGVRVQAGSGGTQGHTATLTVNGGKLTASGDAGIEFNAGNPSYDITTELTVSGNALVDTRNGGIEVYGTGAVNTTADDDATNGGIVFDGGTGTVYGDVTLQEDLAIGEGESLKLDDGASLNTNGKLTVDGGTLTGDVTGTVIYKVTDVSLDKSTLSLIEGENEQLIATVQPSNATNKTVTWESSNTDVATVSDGVVTAVSPGTATITVKTEDGSHTATCAVTVAAASYNISVDPSTLNFGSITEGEERPAAQTVTVKNTGNQTVTLNPPTAENFEIAKIDELTLNAGESVEFTIQPKDNLPRGSYSEQIVVSNTNGEKATITATFTVKEPPYTGKYSYEVSTSVGDHGSLTVDRYATEGEKVTITVTPDDAYLLDDLSVTAGGKDVELVDNGDGTFSFTMPSADVKITATFAEDPDWTEPEEPATDVSDLFIDIAPNAWYKDAVQYAYDNGLMTGVSANEFAPEATTTRAMIVSMLARLEGVESAESAGFTDVAANDWYATAVNWAAASGITSGTGDGNFSPNTAITREQLAAILMNYAAYKGEDVSARADLEGYTDQPSTWAQEAISWSVAEGLLTGVTADTLQPQGAATRAQVAAILQRFLSE